ncbi:MAG TPA: transketolase, partial [Planctomycetaceae bacterium]|nr:transketolase [Planctomycetaceae bacterium]
MSTTDSSLADLSINTIRTLSMDAVERAKSGHPGTPMALAPVAYVLWTKFLRFDPEYPEWPDRDRFILSCGHASMLLYSLIHLSGIRTARGSDEPAITLDDIRRFRQRGSRCAGHPEFGEAAGIETTTGPLGQGVGNSVGMAAASAWLGARYNRPGQELFRHRVFALCSDGDLMEGVASEAASLAGHWKLGNLCWIYDDNQITIEGRTDLAFSENVPQRFEALGWRTYQVDDANDLEQLEAAFEWF